MFMQDFPQSSSGYIDNAFLNAYSFSAALCPLLPQLTSAGLPQHQYSSDGILLFNFSQENKLDIIKLNLKKQMSYLAQAIALLCTPYFFWDEEQFGTSYS